PVNRFAISAPPKEGNWCSLESSDPNSELKKSLRYRIVIEIITPCPKGDRNLKNFVEMALDIMSKKYPVYGGIAS
ncbi:MAG: hypothetical protein LBD94_00325, partial [Rickettsiales bacterium]|nr:hypothetical protein [Rickettsiales bacterium]